MIRMSELAIHGGAPIRKTLLPYGKQSIDETDVEAVAEALRSEFLTTGPLVDKFERVFAEMVGAKYAVAVSSGTAALHAAASAAGLRAGDNAIVPPMSFVATANCVRYVGASVLFADVIPETLTLSTEKMARVVTAQTKAIVTVDYAGQPSDLEDLTTIAHRHGLVLIEDAAHALGATYHGRPVGSIADLTTFSLHPVKHITTGEGGVVATNDSSLATHLKAFRNHGIKVDYKQREKGMTWFYDVEGIGYNYRITDIQCALGLSQLKRLKLWIDRRRVIARAYDRAFAELPGVKPLVQLPDRESVFHLYVVLLDLNQFRAGRSEIFSALRAENIGVNVHYIPIPWHQCYRDLGFRPGQWPNAEGAYERMLSLPIFPAMMDDDVGDVITAVRKVVAYYRK